MRQTWSPPATLSPPGGWGKTGQRMEVGVKLVNVNLLYCYNFAGQDS